MLRDAFKVYKLLQTQLWSGPMATLLQSWKYICPTCLELPDQALMATDYPLGFYPLT